MIDNWKRYSINMPPEGIRFYASDGETTCICRYVISDNHINIIYDSESFKDMKIEFWQELPPLPPKIEVISAEL